MAFKVNIASEIDTELERLLPQTDFRSKTEYINQAIAEFNKKLTRAFELEKLKKRYQSSKIQKEAKEILHDFAEIRCLPD